MDISILVAISIFLSQLWVACIMQKTRGRSEIT